MLVDDECNSCCWMNCDVWMMQRSIRKVVVTTNYKYGKMIPLYHGFSSC